MASVMFGPQKTHYNNKNFKKKLNDAIFNVY